MSKMNLKIEGSWKYFDLKCTSSNWNGWDESWKSEQNLESNLDFSMIDLAPNGIPFGVKSIGKMKFQSKIRLH